MNKRITLDEYTPVEILLDKQVPFCTVKINNEEISCTEIEILPIKSRGNRIVHAIITVPLPIVNVKPKTVEFILKNKRKKWFQRIKERIFE